MVLRSAAALTDALFAKMEPSRLLGAAMAVELSTPTTNCDDDGMRKFLTGLEQ
jgi:hypothetical protein